MFRRNTLRLAAALLVAALSAVPALAAPTAGHTPTPALAPLELVATWWADLTGDLVRLVDRNGARVDPDGATSTSTDDDPTVEPQNGPWVDPNG